MAFKLSQYNFLGEEIIKLMDDDTLLIITSDHGATKSGEHGGTSKAETSSFLFAYSKTGFRDEIYDPKYLKVMGRGR